eukprot:2409133-Rhodomonas_salina.6
MLAASNAQPMVHNAARGKHAWHSRIGATSSLPLTPMFCPSVDLMRMPPGTGAILPWEIVTALLTNCGPHVPQGPSGFAPPSLSARMLSPSARHLPGAIL